MKANKETVQKYNELIENYIDDYSVNKKPIEVSFRTKVDELKNNDRHSHLIHSYPAKLLMHIPYFFLNNTILSKEGDTVLDPFCGTGTVLLESIVSNRNAIGADANPLARLISQVKTQKLDEKKIKAELGKILNKSKKYKTFEIPDVVNIDHWFPKNTQINLAKLLKSIKGVKDDKTRSFFLICFSNCVKKVSFADPRIAVPVKLNPERFKDDNIKFKDVENTIKKIKKIDVFEKFKSISLQNIERISRLNEISVGRKAQVISKDARDLTITLKSKRKLKENSVQLIISSPPYAGAQKYIRSSSLNLGWLEMATTSELLNLDKKNIGRENYKSDELQLQLTGITKADKLIRKVYKIDKVRAKIVSQYLSEMESAISESIRVLKKGGNFVLIVGNNKVCNEEFNTQEYLTEIMQKKGLKLLFKLIDDIKSYGLMTKRNKTADIISREWVLVFKKI